MNYAKEREIAKKKKNKVKIVIFVIIAVFFIVMAIVSCFTSMDSWIMLVQLPKISCRGDGEMCIHFIDVGQGDASVIEFPDGKTALIDGGDDTDKTKTTVVRYLNALKIDVIDYLIVTHADADHCGGLDAVLRHKQVVKAFVPVLEEDSGLQYVEFYQGLEKEGCEIVPLSRQRICSYSEEVPYTFSLLYPYAPTVMEEASDNNERSGVVWLEYEGIGTIFMGDAPSSVEDVLLGEAKNGMLQLFAPNLHGTEIIKISHHGASTATGSAFLQYLCAETAIISCGKNNVYGHPTQETLKTLTDANVTAYRTDTSGHIMITVRKDDTPYLVQNISK